MQANKINLLVIDDDYINIFIINKIVKRTGFDIEMISKGDGQQAISYLEDIISKGETLPKLILIDINMPVMNGWEFVEAYENLGIQTDISLYILSSSVYENDIEKTKSYKSVKGFISKPLSPERLMELISPFRF